MDSVGENSDKVNEWEDRVERLRGAGELREEG